MDIKNSQLIQTIQSIYHLPEELLHLILEIVKIYEFPSRYKLIKEGSFARRIYFVEKGALRSYFSRDGNEITTWFTFENNFSTSFYSFISGEPSFETIELLEDSVLYGIAFDDLNTLTNKYPEINHLYRKVLELNFVIQEKKMTERYELAVDRYQDLINNNPQIIQRVPLGYIASYLGITQSTLSRIRKQ